MKKSQDKSSKLQKPLRPRLPLRNAAKESSKPQPTTTKSPGGDQVKTTLSKQLILDHALFWKQQTTELPQIKSLILSDLELASFEPSGGFSLLELSNIELLSLSKNMLVSLQPLAELDSLVQLNLNHNQIFDVSPLSFLERLESLYLNNNRVSDLSPLFGLHHLKNLYVYNNLIPYRDKTSLGHFAQQLVEFDVEKNDVYRQEEKDQWLKGKLRKFNNEPVSFKMKNEIQMSSTSQSFRPFSSALMSRPSTGRPTTAMGVENSQANIQTQVEQAETTYHRLDNQYEEEIVKNVKLKGELERRLQSQRLAGEKGESRVTKLKYIEDLKQQISSLRAKVLTPSNPVLEQLLELTIKFQRLKSIPKGSLPAVPLTVSHGVPSRVAERPFHADEQLVFEDDERPDKVFENSDDELQEILRRNAEELELLAAELNSLK